MREMSSGKAKSDFEPVNLHPCFGCYTSEKERMHLPVAGKNNITYHMPKPSQTASADTSAEPTRIMRPEEAVAQYFAAKKHSPRLSIVGIAGPYEPLADFDTVKRTFMLIREKARGDTFCLSTNGLMLPFYANHLISLGVTHVSINIRTISPEHGAKIYQSITYLGKTIFGEEAVCILLQNQITGIRYLTDKGIQVKANILLPEQIDLQETQEMVSKVKEYGCTISNIIAPVGHSLSDGKTGSGELRMNRIRNECEDILPQMYFCKNCPSEMG